MRRTNQELITTNPYSPASDNDEKIHFTNRLQIGYNDKLPHIQRQTNNILISITTTQ